MTILVTGGGGYLGTVLVRQILTTTHADLMILDRFSWGAQPLLGVIPVGEQHRVRIYRGDVRQIHDLQPATAGCDQIIHLAGVVGYPACDADPQDADSTNVYGTWNVCRIGLPVVFASTGSCYGKVDGVATEETPINPLTRYGRNKAEAEGHVLRSGGVVLRLATLFGISPRMRWDLLPNDFCRRGVAGEIQLFEAEACRTFLHVEDAARAFRLAVDGHIPSGVWNIGSVDLNWTKRQVAGLVQTLTGCTVSETEGRDPDQRDYAVSYDKVVKRVSRFVPRHSLKQSLPAVVQAARVWR